MTRHTYAILGAGNGGQAFAGHLSLRGYRVRLWNRTAGRLAGIERLGGIPMAGSIDGMARPELLTTDLAQAVSGAHVIMVVMPATGHRPVAAALAPLVRPDQIVVLNPGRTGGALEVRNTLLAHGAPADVMVAEAQSLLYACRVLADGTCHVYSAKRFVPLAAVPAAATRRVIAALNPAFPQFYAAASVLETSLDNMGAIFHPGVTLLNAARIEATGGDFSYYREGVTPAVARVIEQVDLERMAVAEAYGVRVRSAKDWLAEAYGAEGDTLLEAVNNNPGYVGIMAPSNLDHRYIWEDVPLSLVPIAEMGRLAGVATPTIGALVMLASAIHGTDYHKVGRNAMAMGLAGLTPGEVLALVQEGEHEAAGTESIAAEAAGSLSG